MPTWGSGLVTAGVVYQRTREVPDPFGVPMGQGATELGLPRSTYLGADWNRTKEHQAQTPSRLTL